MLARVRAVARFDLLSDVSGDFVADPSNRAPRTADTHRLRGSFLLDVLEKEGARLSGAVKHAAEAPTGWSLHCEFLLVS